MRDNKERGNIRRERRRKEKERISTKEGTSQDRLHRKERGYLERMKDKKRKIDGKKNSTWDRIEIETNERQ